MRQLQVIVDGAQVIIAAAQVQHADGQIAAAIGKSVAAVKVCLDKAPAAGPEPSRQGEGRAAQELVKPGNFPAGEDAVGKLPGGRRAQLAEVPRMSVVRSNVGVAGMAGSVVFKSDMEYWYCAWRNQSRATV